MRVLVSDTIQLMLVQELLSQRETSRSTPQPEAGDLLALIADLQKRIAVLEAREAASGSQQKAVPETGQDCQQQVPNDATDQPLTQASEKEDSSRTHNAPATGSRIDLEEAIEGPPQPIFVALMPARVLTKPLLLQIDFISFSVVDV